MRFLLMIWDNHAEWATVTPSDMDRVMQTHAKMQTDLQTQGKWIGCDRLRHEAATVRVKNGEPLVSDGPFAETKEVMGGFYLIDCASQAEAIEWAKRLPLAEGRSSVEVRAIWDE